MQVKDVVMDYNKENKIDRHSNSVSLKVCMHVGDTFSMTLANVHVFVCDVTNVYVAYVYVHRMPGTSGCVQSFLTLRWSVDPGNRSEPRSLVLFLTRICEYESQTFFVHVFKTNL